MTSSTEPVLHGSPGVLVDPDGVVRDVVRRARPTLSTAQHALLLRVLSAGSAGYRWHGADPPADVVRLVTSGLVRVDLGRGARARAYLRGLRSGDDSEIRMARRLAERRLEVAAPPLAALVVAWVATWRAHRAAVVAVSVLTGLLAVVLGAGPTSSAAACALPFLPLGTVAVHEAAHLEVVRRVTRDRRAGAVVYGPSRVAVARPALRGRTLRVVGASGPCAGAVSAGMLAALGPWEPWFVVGALVGFCYHVANLVPWATDGRHVWTGRESGPDPRPRPGVADATPAAA